MLNDFLNYLGGLGGGAATNGPGIEAGGAQPNFWQNIGGAFNRSQRAGGGLGGLFAAFNPANGQGLASTNPGTVSSPPIVPNTPTTAATSNQGSGLNWGAQPNGQQKGLGGL